MTDTNATATKRSPANLLAEDLVHYINDMAHMRKLTNTDILEAMAATTASYMTICIAPSAHNLYLGTISGMASKVRKTDIINPDLVKG
jgi:hypothetical protein